MAREPRPPESWRDPRHRLGLEGEAAARRHLEAGGWEVVDQRFRLGREELDLVARRNGLVAFVEVKTRRGTRFGPGREAIGWRKRRAIGRVAEAWRQRYGVEGELYRFDVVEVFPEIPGVPPRVEHIEDAWRLDSLIR